METEFDQSEAASGTTEESAPATVGAVDFDKFKEELLGTISSSFEERFKGFQKPLTKLNSRLDELEKNVQQANRAELTEDERLALDAQEKDEQIARLQMELELRDLGREYPDAAPHFDRILKAESPREQLEILQGLLKPSAEEPSPEQSTPASGSQNQNSVDVNNPADTGVDGMDYEEAFTKDPSLLDRILKSAPRLRSPE